MSAGGAYACGMPSRSAASVEAPRTSIYGVGVDVLQLSRIADVYERHGDRFVQRLLHPAEYARLARSKTPVNYLAKCFAVKEAFVKALGTGFRGVAHDDVGWTRVEHQRPELVFSAKLQARLDALGIIAAHLSVSDEKDLICAMVTLERGE